MIRVMYRPSRGTLVVDYPVEELDKALQDKRGLVWVDWLAATPEECEPILREVFGFHPLAIDDALRESHVPKVDDWGEYVYIALHSVHFKPERNALDTNELDIFLGPNFLVTYHLDPISIVDRVWAICEHGEQRLRGGPDHLVYEVVNKMASNYMQVMDELDHAIDSIQDEVFKAPTPRTLERILVLKRAVLYLRRILSPQREVLNKLARDDYAVIDAKDRVYFRDVYDHLARLHDVNESLQDLVGSALDTYLSVTSNKINEVMKVLTAIMTLFMPLSFLSAFFGMNFFVPVGNPGPVGSTTMVMALVLMIVIPLAMVWWIRRRGWL